MRICSTSKGFTLIELMIVISVIAVIAALAMPKSKEFKKKAMQLEAKNNLRHILTLQEAYKGEFDTYLNNFNEPCSDPISECQNRLILTRGNTSNYENDAAPDACLYGTSNNTNSINYHRTVLGFKPADCRQLRYSYVTNGFYSVAQELGTTRTNPDRRVFMGCTQRFDTWVLTHNQELRHSGTTPSDQNMQTTTVGYNSNEMCF